MFQKSRTWISPLVRNSMYSFIALMPSAMPSVALSLAPTEKRSVSFGVCASAEPASVAIASAAAANVLSIVVLPLL